MSHKNIKKWKVFMETFLRGVSKKIQKIGLKKDVSMCL